jgi:site-specific recombinase XerD
MQVNSALLVLWIRRFLMTTAIISYEQNEVMPSQANTDAQMIALWLHGKPATTARTYMDAITRLSLKVAKPLNAITLRDLQDFADSLVGLSDNSRKRIIASVKSLFTFGNKLGYIRFNVAAALKSPKVKDELAARILTEEEVLTMIHKTGKQRDQVLLRLMYASAGRISEVCSLTWADVQPNGDSGQVTLFGKGGKTRAVKLSKATWNALQALRPMIGHGSGCPLGAVFVSQKGGRLDETQVHRIVKAAAVRAGIAGNVSAHWLRHSHASHALDRGANIALVRDTLGHSSLAVTSRYTHAKPNESSALHLAV